MKKVLLFFLLLAFAGCSKPAKDNQSAENVSSSSSVTYPLTEDTDTLLLLLKALPDDTNKVNVLNELAWQLKYNNPDTSVILSKEALAISEKLSASEIKEISLGGKKGEASSLGNLGAFHFLKSDYANALDYYFKALKKDEELDNKKRIASHYGNIGIVYRNQADYAKALEYYFIALKIDEQLRSSKDKTLSTAGKKGMATRYGNIGIVYDEQADFQKAREYYLKALQIDQEMGNANGTAIRVGNIGVAYFNEAELIRKTDTAKASQNYSKALDYYLKALTLDEELDNKNRIAYDWGNIGNVHHKQGDLLNERGESARAAQVYSIALEDYQKGLKMSRDLENPHGISIHLGNMGSLYTSLERYNDAFTSLYDALEISDSIGAKDFIRYDYEQLSTLYKKSSIPLQDTVGGKPLSRDEMRLRSLFYYKKYIAVRDSIYSEENKTQIMRKEMSYDFEKKEAAALAERDKKDALAKENLKQKERERNYFIIGFALVVLLAGFVFRSYRQKQKANEIISEQKLLVEEKQKEILDSIHYAKRIQRSLLPTGKYIERNFKRLNKNSLVLVLSLGFAFCACPESRARNGKIDSLLALVKKEHRGIPGKIIAGDTARIQQLNELAWQYYRSAKVDSALYYCGAAQKFGEALLKPAGSKTDSGQTLEILQKELIEAYTRSGSIYDEQGDPEKALEYFFISLQKSRDAGIKKEMSVSLGNIGNVYQGQGNSTKALEYYFEALKIDEEIGYKKGVAIRLSSIGNINNMLGNYSKALEYYLKSLKINKELDRKNSVAINLSNIGQVYHKQKNYPKALEHYTEARDIFEKLKNANGISVSTANIGSIYKDQAEISDAEGQNNAFVKKLYDIALDHYFKALKIDEFLGSKENICTRLVNIGSIRASTGKYGEASDFLYRALSIADSIKDVNVKLESYLQLSRLYERSTLPLKDTIDGKVLNTEGMRLRAIDYYKIYIGLKDKLMSEDNKKELLLKEMNFDFEKKEAARQAEQDKKDALAKEELKQKEQERNYFITGFVLVALLFIFIFRGYRQKQKANEIISAQKILVEEKQKEILDSIHYARRIQQSLLPTEKYIERSLKRLNTGADKS